MVRLSPPVKQLLDPVESAPLPAPVVPVTAPLIDFIDDLEELLMDWPAPIDGNAPAIAGSPWLEEPVVEAPELP